MAPVLPSLELRRRFSYRPVETEKLELEEEV